MEANNQLKSGCIAEHAIRTKPVLSLQLFEQLHQLADQQGLTENITKRHVSWILRYLRFLNEYHAQDMSDQQAAEVFLSRLATRDHCEPATQIHAEQALIYYYQQFLKRTLGDLHFLRLKQRRGFFSRFGETHCAAVLCKLRGNSQLMAKLAVATHLKLREVVNLHVADVDLKQNTLTIRTTDGQVKFVTNIPVQLVLDLRIQIMKVNYLVNQENERLLVDGQETPLLESSVLQASSQFLFPYRYKASSLTQSSAKNSQKSLTGDLSATPMAILKNDIRIAIQSYLRFLPDAEQSVLPIRMPTRRPTGRQVACEKRLLARKNHSRYAQKSFNFWDELGAA